MVDVQSTTAFMLLPDVVDELRLQLARDRPRLDRAWSVTRRAHASAAPAIVLEEEVNYLAIAEGGESPALQRRLQEAVVALVEGGEDRVGVARWAARAFSRLPAAVARSEAGLMLTVAARSRLGGPNKLPEGVTAQTPWLPWVLPRATEPVRIGVRLFDEGLELGEPDETTGHVVPLPRTDPLVLDVSWREGQTEGRRYLHVRPDRVERIHVPNARAATFTLQTAWGDSYVIRPRAAPVPIEIRAHAGGRSAFVAWRPSTLIPGSIGFALRRREVDRRGQVVETRLGFDTPPSPSATTSSSTAAPLQRYTWLDSAGVGGEHVQYQVTPILGSPDHHREGPGSDWTDPIAASTLTDPLLHVVFNRGVLGLPDLATRLGSNAPPLPQLLGASNGEPREYLGGDLRTALMTFLAAIRDGGGSLRAALYELNDPETLMYLGELGPRADLLVDKRWFDSDAVKPLLSRGVRVQAAVQQRGGLFHHYFAVACDASGAPERVWIGGASWTTVGLLLQPVSALLVDSRELAAVFLEQWQRMRAGAVGLSRGPTIVPVGSAKASVWFSPVQREADLLDVDHRVASARRGVLFAVPFARQWFERVQRNLRSELYVRGAVTGARTNSRAVTLFDGARPQLVAPSAFVSSAYRKQLQLSQFNEFLARIVAIDPLDRDATVITGSHNLSASGSGRNHEALIAIEHAPALATAYAVRVMELYEHYALRGAAARSSQRPLAARSNDDWQKHEFTHETERELDFWVGRGS